MTTTYTCQKCAKPAQIVNGNAVPSCQCKAPIFANLKATVTGKGGVK